jgi:hypothetical protein
VADTFTLRAGAVLTVPPVSAAKPDAGHLLIKANKITIEAGAKIVADGAGYAGVAGAAGLGPTGAGSAGGGYSASRGAPGGGGAFAGAGAPGLIGACMPGGGTGGVAFFGSNMPSFGAAGGAADTGSALGTAGANGGGMIVLEAAEMQLDGILSAAGGSVPQLSGVGRGGGAGGSIVIVVGNLSGMGTFVVRGGDGSHGTGSTNPASPFPVNDAGGGGGGVLMFVLTHPLELPDNTRIDHGGGKSGDCSATGGDGQLVALTQTTDCVDLSETDPETGVTSVAHRCGFTCPDLDGDGFPALSCGGTDCDDTDAAIHPNVAEVCDGKDNDCNGKTDDDAICPLGAECVSGKCVQQPDAGHDGGSECDGGDSCKIPDHLQFTGGCAVPEGSDLPEGPAGAAALAAGLLALAARRRRSAR